MRADTAIEKMKTDQLSDREERRGRFSAAGCPSQLTMEENGRMPPRSYSIMLGILILGLFLVTTGCKSTDSSAPSNVPSATASSPAAMTSPAATSPYSPATSTVKAKVDACALLTSDDLKAVQGEALKEAQRSDRRDGDFIVAQCYYALPTTSNSVVLNVTTANEARSAVNPRSFWQNTFARKEEKGKERERGNQAKPEGEDEADAQPEKVAGLGEDAYWIANRVGGALYVLKKDVFFRISVGGAGDEKAKLKKSKTLAQQVLKRI
jgi:hypothetical protein